MIYIKENENNFEKYEVKFDEIALKKLRTEIVINCSETTHVKKECRQEEIPNSIAIDNAIICYIENVRYWKSGHTGIELDDYYEYEYDLYYCEYIFHECQPLVCFIDNIIFGDEKSLEILFDKNFASIEKFPTVKEKIFMLKEESEKINSNNRKKLKELYTELKELLEMEELNEGQEPVEPYFYKLASLVDFKLIDTISKEEINRVNNFFGEEKIPLTKKKTLGRKK